MNTLVLYYSRTGNNRYLAEHVASHLNADLEAIRPRLGGLLFQILFSFLPFSPGIRPLTHDVQQYDRLVVCGPVWMGRLIAPLRTALKRYGTQVDEVDFATCCGSVDADKDGTFGYEGVFRQVRTLLGDRCRQCAAFPVVLTLPEDKRKDDEAVMNALLSDESFGPELQSRLDDFLTRLA
ncbi:flavodoxin family protein [Saccharospirillum salsuginis]|uniref:Flavodoxin n=1 Tax=Saccharospirillum salsuginis TaxID=418750 RepID=A0A918N9T8_9GAMM|nr:hypothetical protein [Saccharospirillum salsuginis]GGX57142.1 hypothetical protein GCM10007392_25820 [Saccharospirillum salsuginis]